MKTILNTDNAPKAIGPYNQSVKSGNMLFCSGQIPLDPSTGEIVASDIESQTRQVFKNLQEVLLNAGMGFENVIKTSVFLNDLNDFQQVNEIYAEFFPADTAPARSTVEVSALPKASLIEIDLIASES